MKERRDSLRAGLQAQPWGGTEASRGCFSTGSNDPRYRYNGENNVIRIVRHLVNWTAGRLSIIESVRIKILLGCTRRDNLEREKLLMENTTVPLFKGCETPLSFVIRGSV